MTKEVNTYPELIKAIEKDITPRIVDFCKITSLTEAISEALNAGPTLQLISEFVGYRHVELLERHAKEQRETSKAKDLFFTKELATGMFHCRKSASTLDCGDCLVSKHCNEVVTLCQNSKGQPDANVTIKEQEP